MRKLHVDLIKAIGIFLVILGHANHCNAPLKVWIYSFHMPVFFFASGLVMKEYPISVYFKTKLRTLLLPFLLWGCIYAAFSMENLVRIVYGSYRSLVNSGTLSSLWYLPVLFLGQLLAQLVRRVFPRAAVSVGICVGLAVCGFLLPNIEAGYPWGINTALLASFFLMLGWTLEETHANDLLVRHRRLGGLLGVIGLSATLAASFGFPNGGYVLMATCSVGKPVIFFVTALGGCLMAYSFSLCIRITNPMFIRAVQYISRNTLLIFTLQKPIISAFEKVFSRFSVPWHLELIVTGCGVLAISCVLSAVITKYVPELAGRKSVVTE